MRSASVALAAGGARADLRVSMEAEASDRFIRLGLRLGLRLRGKSGDGGDDGGDSNGKAAGGLPGDFSEAERLLAEGVTVLDDGGGLEGDAMAAAGQDEVGAGGEFENLAGQMQRSLRNMLSPWNWLSAAWR